jgi:hypothetical protein
VNIFGKYAIAQEITHYFAEEPEKFWKICPVDSGMELEMSKFLNHKRLISSPEGVVELPPTAMEIAFREVALTFGGTNIPKEYDKPVDEGGEPYIEVGAPVEMIEALVAKMPHDMFYEIWTAVGQAYPHWGPAQDPKGT